MVNCPIVTGVPEGYSYPAMLIPTSIFDRTLFELEQKIARRADALDREYGFDAGHALEHWRQAEEEVWSSWESATPFEMELS